MRQSPTPEPTFPSLFTAVGSRNIKAQGKGCVSRQTARSRQRQAPLKGLTAAQVQLQTGASPRGSAEPGGKATPKDTGRQAHASPAGPDKRRAAFPVPSLYHPSGHSAHPPRKVEARSTARLVQEKTGNRKRGWLGPQLPGQVSRGLRCRHPRRAVRIPRWPPCFSAAGAAPINRGSMWVRGGSGGKA